MLARRKQRDPQLDAIGTRVAAVLIAELDVAGFPVDWQVYGPLLEADGPILRELHRVEIARQAAAYQSRDEARAAWAQEAGAASWEARQEHWALSGPEMHAARDLGLIRAIDVPGTLHKGFHTPVL